MDFRPSGPHPNLTAESPSEWVEFPNKRGTRLGALATIQMRRNRDRRKVQVGARADEEQFLAVAAPRAVVAAFE
jgi:hypothetical protein